MWQLNCSGCPRQSQSEVVAGCVGPLFAAVVLAAGPVATSKTLVSSKITIKCVGIPEPAAGPVVALVAEPRPQPVVLAVEPAAVRPVEIVADESL